MHLSNDVHPDAPPSYESLYGRGGQYQTSQAWATERAEPPLPARPRQNTYTRNQGEAVIEITLHPEPLVHQRRHQPWFGNLRVKCDHVRRVMYDGFHWKPSNIVRSESYYESGIRDPPSYLQQSYGTIRDWNPGWTEARHFIMRDLKHEPPHWVAKLSVYAKAVDILEVAELEGLRVENMVGMRGYGRFGETLYRFDSREPLSGKNNVYIHEGYLIFGPRLPFANDILKKATKQVVRGLVR
ncbi:hypothetical protein BKA67DRAFT_534284 [Truncatella angustata]|uniref:Uncharacterized protein n=1 Tax=Truncatella angustata TaxID=152316 RepID=A0A9P8UNV7_9PEZI|nr:uncharacterized protein BKA67DRAFT_534284 [Truncatella angustata]KAH6655354.1 hypothetical protein BKA67DRAFT_534284 [Truncatella angustata]